ncbi:hypothetical protein Sjap_021040 [Stephania japonica]|uniref:WRKY19-like zinc finger domain-containing protein n=1 Tax=Stephania japonica TaxID=461633 RepID=A0AAP0I0S1_9MAGN
MYSRFHHFGLNSDASTNAFEKPCDLRLGRSGPSYFTSTDLSLDSPGAFIPFGTSKGTKRKWSGIDGSVTSRGGSSLVLGVGSSSSSSDSKGSSETACTTVGSAKEIEESSMDLDLNFNLNLSSEFPSPKRPAHSVTKGQFVKPALNLELSLSIGHSESAITSITFGSTAFHNNSETPSSVSKTLLADDGSTSSPWKVESFKPLLHAGDNSKTSFDHCQVHSNTNPVHIVPDLLPAVGTTPIVSIRSTTSGSGQRTTNGKTCQFKGCAKGARGASGLCIAHGGGRRCQKSGCYKGAEGRTVYCKAHGGGRRCQYLGCTKSAEGRTDYCIAHGGGRRCSHEGCTRAARGKSGLCIRHGGGKRCQMENCMKSAEGFSGLCISHGGGRRCQFSECTKGAQGSTMFCKAHGGGKRCTAPNCTKGAEGSTPFCKGHGGGKRCSFQGGGVCPKSVHGGTLFCVAHGGGKRCLVPECTKSARGRTDYCVRHGGGKRCKFEGCGKSAQGSTDFCKAHGGGKRCSWGQLGPEFANQSSGPCERFARGKTGLCAAHSALVQDKRVHGGGQFGPIIPDLELSEHEKVKEVAAIENENDTDWNMGQVGGTSFDGQTHSNLERHEQPSVSMRSQLLCPAPLPVSEGRVRRGNLMSLMTSNSGLGLSSENHADGGVSETRGMYHVMPHNWI